jgi:hypothetical protein
VGSTHSCPPKSAHWFPVGFPVSSFLAGPFAGAHSASPFPAVVHGWFRSNSRSTDGSIFSIWLSGNGATPVAEPAPLERFVDGAAFLAAAAAISDN